MWAVTMAENRILKLGKRTDFEVHQIEHQLAAYTDCNHGCDLAVLHPVYYRHIYAYGLKKFVRFAVNVWQLPNSGDDLMLALAGIDALEAFIREIGLPTTQRALGVTEDAPLEAVAGVIAQHTGTGVLELQALVFYTDEDLDWTNEKSRVSAEHEQKDTIELELTQATTENWSDYDTVFIGYPIRWHEATWPVDTFIRANDFTGKTVIPFCTSSASDLGDSAKLLAQMAGTGEWLEGVRFPSSVTEDEVINWLDSLAL